MGQGGGAVSRWRLLGERAAVDSGSSLARSGVDTRGATGLQMASRSLRLRTVTWGQRAERGGGGEAQALGVTT